MSERRKGAVLAYVQIFLNMAVTLAFTPIMVGSLGKAGYGLFSIVSSLVAYMNLMDMGMNDAVMRNIVRLRNQDGAGAANDFLGSMLSVYTFAGVMVLAVAGLILALLDNMFGRNMSASELTTLAQMLMVMAACVSVSISLNPIGALLVASERFTFLRSLEMAVNLGSTTLIVILLQRGFGPVMASACTGGTLVVLAMAKVAYARWSLGAKIRWRRFTFTGIRPVLLYSAPIFLSIIIEMIYWKLDSILIGAFLGAAVVAPYAVGLTFNKYFMRFGTAISRVMIPEIIRRVDAKASPDELTALMVRVSRLQALVVLLILTGLVVFGREFLLLWLGPDFEISYFVMLFALCPYTLELVGNVRNVLLQARDLYWYRVGIVGSMALLNIPLTIWFLKVFGVVGAAASTGLCVMIGYAALAFVLQHKLGLRMMDYYSGLARGILPATALALVAGLTLSPLWSHGWLGLATKVMIYSILYAALMWWIGMEEDEKKLFRKTTGSVLRLGHAR